MKVVWNIFALCLHLAMAKESIDVLAFLNKVQDKIDADVAVRSLKGTGYTRAYKSSEL